MTFPTPVPQVLGCSAELRRLQAQHWEESRMADATTMTKNTNKATETSYFVAPAPGHYGDRARVISAHRTLQAARKAATRGFVVRAGGKRKGDEWLRADEQHYPIA